MSLLARWQTRSSDPETRKRAAEKLGASGGRAALDALVSMLGDDDPPVRVSVLQALGNIGDASATRPVITAVAASDALPSAAGVAVRQSAIAALRRFGHGAVPALAAAAREKNQRVREAAIEALGGIGCDEAMPVLTAALGDDRSSVRQAAARGLGRAGSSAAVAALASAIGHRDGATRRTVVEALGEAGGDRERAADALGRALTDQEGPVREAAVKALGRNGSRRAAEALLAAYQGTDRDLRAMAADALRGMAWEPGDDRERAIAAVINGDFAAAAALGPAAVEPLVGALSVKDVDARRAVTEAIGLTGDSRAARALAGALADRNESVRTAAQRTLAQLGPAAAPPVIDLLEDQPAQVIQAASEVLREIGESRTVGYLLESLPGAGSVRHDHARLIAVPGPETLDQARTTINTIECLLRHKVERIDAKTLTTLASHYDLARLSELPRGRDVAEAVEERLSLGELRHRAASEMRRRGLDVPEGAD